MVSQGVYGKSRSIKPNDFPNGHLQSKRIGSKPVRIVFRPRVIRVSFVHVPLSGFGDCIVDNLHERPSGEDRDWLKIVRCG